MDFLLYEPEDFASNESYLNYYFRLNDSDVDFWQQWISNHPEKLDCIINADQLINLLALQMDESELSQEYQRLSSAIEDPGFNNLPHDIEPGLPAIDEHIPPPVTHQSPILSDINKIKQIGSLKKMQAGVALFLLTGVIWFFSAHLRKNPLPAENTTWQPTQFIKKVNTGTVLSRFQLEDGSVITLQPGSVLNYPPHFLTAKREVYLDGEAFFEVSKNKKRPFYVYCRSMVAHVLGTSFNIKTDKLHGKVEVTVTTGKVEVYQKNTRELNGPGKKGDGLILTPNHKAVYLEETNHFESSLVDTPLPIPFSGKDNRKDSLRLETIYLKAVPVSEILRSLEKSYGIEIEVENENINNCHFSGDLLDMNLYVKLDIICQSLNASYEVKGTKILIRGKGCN